MKSNDYISLAVLLLMLSVRAFAAPPVEWEKTFGGPNDDGSFSVQQTSDGGFVIVGQSKSYGAGNYDVYLIKTDAVGNEVWSNTFGGSEWDGGTRVRQTMDGGYIIVGFTASYGAGDRDVYLIKTDAAGNETWSNTFGGAEWDLGASVEQTSDGGYIITGNTGSYGAGEQDVYLIKTDAAGNDLWSTTFGGSRGDSGDTVMQTADDGYIISGLTQSSANGSYDAYVIKTDALGNEIWSKTHGGSDDYLAGSMLPAADAGYVRAGFTGLWDEPATWNVYLLKIDALGNEIWSKTFGGSDSDWGNSIQGTNDGGYIISGQTKSYGAGDYDAYLIKTDAAGNEIWSTAFGGVATEYGRSVQQTADGGFIVAGSTQSYGAGLWDVYLVKIGPDVPACNGDVDKDGDVDGDDLNSFASDFGRTDCPCKMESAATSQTTTVDR